MEADMERELSFVNSSSKTLNLSERRTSLTDLTPEQQLLLEQLRERLEDILRPEHNDYYLCRWLKARCYDVNKAENMFRESMRYREEMGLDRLLQEYTPPEVLDKYLAGGFCGFDKEGSPIKVELFGHLDMKGIMYSCKRSDLEKTKMKHCEFTQQVWREQSEQLGRRVDGLTVIFDMDKVQMTSLWRPGIQMYLHLVSLLEDNYPEMMTRMFVINAPSYLNLFWKACKPLISDDMRKKIHICGRDYSAVLLRFIDEDQLPVFLGGTKTDINGDPRCSEEICQGGEVPPSYHLSDSKYLETMDCDTIRAGNKLSIEKVVEQPNTILKWEFRTDDHDIGFGVMYKEMPLSPEKEVVPVKRIKSHQIMEDGQYLCQDPGIYLVVFNNTHSWWTSKMVYHKIELHP